ncbi:hypothetical protein EXIGLDRAFT_718402 [Exidia glandulosa HHB12029]|uniref:F-box domain-containing protein n=1 Tax=Exidia glandulosa HHB12029 TaxID=1314781 RepID=A0A165HSS4_EXIGL|nr:hypothetical protein EXIGLDRAFT_718402 [Exidia glandulosa HHB12029]
MSISGPSARSYNTTALPFELLSNVFARDKDPGVLMTLALVCHQWKDVVYQEAALWTDIRIDPSTTMRQLDTQLLRSRDLRLDIVITFAPPRVSAMQRQVMAKIMLDYDRISRLMVDARLVEGHDEEYGDRWMISDWPDEIATPLQRGYTWPNLRILELITEVWVRQAFDPYIVAPNLEELYLEGLGVRYWELMEFGDALKDIEMRRQTLIDHSFFDALENYPNLRQLVLDDEAFGEDDLYWAISPLAGPSTLGSLASLDIVWHEADLQSFLTMLKFCPQLESLSLYTDFHLGDGESSYELPGSLQLLRLTTLELRFFSEKKFVTILDILSPALRSSPIRNLALRDVTMTATDIAYLIVPRLRSLKLESVRCDVGAALDAIQSCQRLRTLVLDQLCSTTDDVATNAEIVALPHIQSAEFTALSPRRLHETATASQPHIAYDDALLRSFFSLLPLPQVSSITVQCIDLQLRDLLRTLEGVGRGRTLSLDIKYHSGKPIFTLETSTPVDGPQSGMSRHFSAETVHAVIVVLNQDITMGLSSLVTLTVDIQRAVDVFAVTVLSIGFPRLSRLELRMPYVSRLGDGPTASEFAVASLNSFVQRYNAAFIDCQCLSTVVFSHPDRSSYDDPVRIPWQLARSFASRFQSDSPIRLLTADRSSVVFTPAE